MHARGDKAGWCKETDWNGKDSAVEESGNESLSQ